VYGVLEILPAFTYSKVLEHASLVSDQMQFTPSFETQETDLSALTRAGTNAF
jgi:hypothetical protein